HFLWNGWRLDALYRRLFVLPFSTLSRVLWQRMDEGIIDDSLDRMARGAGRIGSLASAWNSGRTGGYLRAFAGGAALIAAYLAWTLR
ncbi:MAG TPA: NADH-quinone oxidoreductase subunit L, partial [Verrucomicrobiae bacterium]|nr:NADH-quinone oxidoreductase subunit L [Verrucomicrobiae bacterium]